MKIDMNTNDKKIRDKVKKKHENSNFYSKFNKQIGFLEISFQPEFI